MAKNAPLFGDLLNDDVELQAELAKTAVAADLAVLLVRAGVTRTELAKRLGWSKARVSQVLGGSGNLTVETIHAVTRALGHRFDVVFRAAGETRVVQLWERAVQLDLAGSNVIKFPSVGYLRTFKSQRANRVLAGETPAMRQMLTPTTVSSEVLSAA